MQLKIGQTQFYRYLSVYYDQRPPKPRFNSTLDVYLFTAPPLTPPSRPLPRGTSAGRRGRGLVLAPPLARRPGSDAPAVTFRGGVPVSDQAVPLGASSASLRTARGFLRSPPPCPGATAAARPACRPPLGEGGRGSLSFSPLPRAGRSGLAAIVRAGDALGWWQRPAGLSWAGRGLAERGWAIWGMEMGLLGRRAWTPAP